MRLNQRELLRAFGSQTLQAGGFPDIDRDILDDRGKLIVFI